MIKKSLFSIVVVALLVGCNSSSSSDDSTGSNSGGVEINTWDYLVPDNSIELSFDEIVTVNSNVISLEENSFRHEYSVISDTEVHGNWRDYEGEYSYKIKDFSGGVTQVVFAPIEESPDYAYSSGGVNLYRTIGDFFYKSRGVSGFSNTSFGTVSSREISGGNCILNNIYDTKELYDGYVYQNVIELKCENTQRQEYGDLDSPMSITGIDRYYEYYQKGIGWIGKVDKTCIVAIVDDYEFIDDDNTTCVKSVTKYKLKH
jgi:hypothetical protein